MDRRHVKTVHGDLQPRNMYVRRSALAQRRVGVEDLRFASFGHAGIHKISEHPCRPLQSRQFARGMAGTHMSQADDLLQLAIVLRHFKRLMHAESRQG